MSVLFILPNVSPKGINFKNKCGQLTNEKQVENRHNAEANGLLKMT